MKNLLMDYYYHILESKSNPNELLYLSPKAMLHVSFCTKNVLIYNDIKVCYISKELHRTA